MNFIDFSCYDDEETCGNDKINIGLVNSFSNTDIGYEQEIIRRIRLEISLKEPSFPIDRDIVPFPVWTETPIQAFCRQQREKGSSSVESDNMSTLLVVNQESCARLNVPIPPKSIPWSVLCNVVDTL